MMQHNESLTITGATIVCCNVKHLVPLFKIYIMVSALEGVDELYICITMVLH